MRTLIAIGVFLALTGTAEAASFCVVGLGHSPQCMYDDVATCVGASSGPNTYCEINPAAHVMYYGGERYCSVQSDLVAQCMYATFSLCSDAAGAGSICMDRGQPEERNPYRYDQRARE